MFKFVALFCLCSVAYCGDPFPMLTPHPVEDKEWCKTGYYQEQDEACCIYHQCEADKMSAYNRTCYCDENQILFWNTELCACATYWTPGSCDPRKNHLCVPAFNPPKEPCKAKGPDECCLIGKKYDDHTEGYGPLYKKEGVRKYSIPEWHDYGYCPEPGTFSVKYCACEHLNTTCACAHWNFSGPDPLLDDGTYMSEGTCEADGKGELVCPPPPAGGGAIVPAEIPATQKIYFGQTGTIFGKVDVNFEGTVVTNESPEAKPPMGHTIKIEIIDCTLSVWLEYWDILVSHEVSLSDAAKAKIQNGGALKKTFCINVFNETLSMCLGVLFDDGTYEENHWTEKLPVGFKLVGNKCPFKLGFTRPAQYCDFGYCMFAWTREEWLHYLHTCEIPETPNPSKGSWPVFADWNDVGITSLPP